MQNAAEKRKLEEEYKVNYEESRDGKTFLKNNKCEQFCYASKLKLFNFR